MGDKLARLTSCIMSLDISLFFFSRCSSELLALCRGLGTGPGLVQLGIDIRNANVHGAVCATRPKASNQIVATVFIAIVGCERGVWPSFPCFLRVI